MKELKLDLVVLSSENIIGAGVSLRLLGQQGCGPSLGQGRGLRGCLMGHWERMGSLGSRQLKDQVSGLQERAIRVRKITFRHQVPWGQAPMDLGKGSGTLGAVLSGLCRTSPGNPGPGLP